MPNRRAGLCRLNRRCVVLVAPTESDGAATDVEKGDYKMILKSLKWIVFTAHGSRTAMLVSPFK